MCVYVCRQDKFSRAKHSKPTKAKRKTQTATQTETETEQQRSRWGDTTTENFVRLYHHCDQRRHHHHPHPYTHTYIHTHMHIPIVIIIVAFVFISALRITRCEVGTRSNAINGERRTNCETAKLELELKRTQASKDTRTLSHTCTHNQHLVRC